MLSLSSWTLAPASHTGRAQGAHTESAVTPGNKGRLCGNCQHAQRSQLPEAQAPGKETRVPVQARAGTWTAEPKLPPPAEGEHCAPRPESQCAATRLSASSTLTRSRPVPGSLWCWPMTAGESHRRKSTSRPWRAKESALWFCPPRERLRPGPFSLVPRALPPLPSLGHTVTWPPPGPPWLWRGRSSGMGMEKKSGHPAMPRLPSPRTYTGQHG